MPIKWTPERDQTLLLKILETSSISVDVKAISEQWPTEEEAPTPRAIQERLHKIRAMAKNKGTGNFKIVGTVGSKSNPGTPSPVKRSAPKAKKDDVPSAGKRKRTKVEADGAGKAKKVKREDVSDEDDVDQGSAIKEGSDIKDEEEY